jgi:hypothetical protein
MSQRVIMPASDSCSSSSASSSGLHTSPARPSVESLLLRAADLLEFHLGATAAIEPAAWMKETINGLKAISLLAGIWVGIEIDDLLKETRLIQGSMKSTSLQRTTRNAGRRLQALIGQAELMMGGLRPDNDSDEAAEETAAELRLIAWRVVAAIAVQHAFLCLLRRRNALDILSRAVEAKA